MEKFLLKTKKYKSGTIVYIKNGHWAKSVGRLAQVIEATYEAGYCKTISLQSKDGETFLFPTTRIRLATSTEIKEWYKLTDNKQPVTIFFG